MQAEPSACGDENVAVVAPCYHSVISRQEGAMHIRFRAILICALVTLPLAAQAQTFPGADWQRKTPAEAGINPQLLKDAIDFSIASEIKNPRDLKLNHYRTFGREPFGDAIGPIKERGELTGVIIHKGVLVAEWGAAARGHDPQRHQEPAVERGRRRLRRRH